MNIWEYVSFLGGIVAIVFLLAVLFEIITAFITNRRKQKMQDELLDDAQKTFKEEIVKKISEEIDKSFKKIDE